jgi:hypothetical protein
LPAASGQNGRFVQIRAAPPEISAKNSAAVERVTRKHIKNREQKIQQTEREEKPRDDVAPNEFKPPSKR